ncbi:hypothetical protein CUJ83_04860 [Methanocella sp. CWC-04]|uniref:Peptidoglycan binding-like domain-containing protein n=2 Tax=Methanooceanicella nereidis TaxID=2052831 RepID=A0AAP2W5I0_9EURY|nr:hypothetical protein [Methanocella sp. CWC-04]
MPKVNPGPIPDDKLLELKNQSDGGKGPVKKMDNRKELVEHVQHMLIALGYDLGDYGPDKNGVDGDFGDATEKAVKDFQEKHKDWEGNALVVDGLVGPRTGNALNRALVGVWYEKYETPRDLTGDVKLVTLTRKMAESEGVSF